jgi:hypothetical protein
MLETACPQAVHLLRLTRPVVLTLGTGPNGPTLGSISYAIIKAFGGRAREISWLIYTLAIVLTLYFIFHEQPNGLAQLRIRLPPARVPARAKASLLSEPLDVGKFASVKCSIDKRPRRPAPKRTHNLGCA